MKLRLHRLSSEPEFFDPITFRSGVNLILGEKTEGDQSQDKKVNGVGKSLCVECIHFALMRGFDETRLSKIPKDKVPDGLTVVLDLSLNGDTLQIRRSFAHPNQPIISRNGIEVSFGDDNEATRFLSDLLFAEQPNAGFSSFRGLMSLLMRDEKSGFSDILKPTSAKGAPGDPFPHLFLLGLDTTPYRNLLQCIKDLEAQGPVITKLKAELTRDGQVQIKDIAAELNQEQAEVALIEKGLALLSSEPAFAAVEGDLNDLESKLEKLRAKRKAVSYQVDQIHSLPQPEVINETDITIVYDRVKAGLGALVAKSLEQAKAFKAEIETFQRSLLHDQLQVLEKEQKELNQEIKTLSEKHTQLVTMLEQKGNLKHLLASLKVAQSKQHSYHRKVAVYEQFGEAKEKKEELKICWQQALNNFRRQLHDKKDVERLMAKEFVDIHERIMGNRNASLTINVNTANKVKHPLELDLRIQDDGSLSIDQTKVFIYDCALMFASCTQGRHPRFLLHDNIFDVDQDTLVQSLNHLQERMDAGEDFQYILTLNREKIEHEERANQIKLDVKSARRATFTKATPFLKFRYQEQQKRRNVDE